MGIEFLLVKDDVREIYDLGKFTGNWAALIAEPGQGSAAERGDPFSVRGDVELVSALLEQDWTDDGVSSSPAYIRRVAEDIIRWAGQSIIRFTSDGSHDGWFNRDGSWDEGRRTGSRYSSDHPEWPQDSE